MLLNEPSPHSTRPAAATAAAVPGTGEMPAIEVDGALAPPRASAEADTVSFGAVNGRGKGDGSGSGDGADMQRDAEAHSVDELKSGYEANSGDEASAGSLSGDGAWAGSASGTGSGADADGGASAGVDGSASDGATADAAPASAAAADYATADGAPANAAAADYATADGDGATADAAAADYATADYATADAAAAEGGRDAISTVALDVEAVKRAVAEGLSVSAADAISTVSLDVEAVKRATAAQAPTVAFSPVDGAGVEAVAEDKTVADEAAEPVDSTEPTGAAERAESVESAEPTDDSTPDSGSGSPADTEPESRAASADLVPSGDTDLDAATNYLASTVLLTQTSTVVAVPETADDVIATIHAAATAVAAADRRARQAAVVKEDPWTDLDLHRPATPAPVGNVLDLLAPVLERPLLVVEQPGLPAAADVVALHRSELEQDFDEPPVVAAGAEPPIPPRFGPGLSVLPHIEFPV